MMDDAIMYYLIEDYLQDKISTDIFVKYFIDIFGHLLNEDNIEHYNYSLYKELNDYIGRYDFLTNENSEIEAGNNKDPYYTLSKTDVRKKADNIFERINYYK